MVKKSFIFTSRPIFEEDKKDYHKSITDTIQNGLGLNGSVAKIKCATRIANQIVFIYVEIVADSKIDVASIVRRKLNALFQNAALFPADLSSRPCN